tara:strand:+ start:293 stop:490 length:198 start_codon:yes stop_codon:yes gene_type:complete
MKVKEIIEKLQQCNPDLECYGYFNDDIREVIMIDDSMDDRIEFNLEELEENVSWVLKIKNILPNF